MLTLGILSGASLSFAECPAWMGGTFWSPNGKHRLAIDENMVATFDGQPRQLKLGGSHHIRAFVSNDGQRYLIADPYDGITVFNRSGMLLERYDGEQLCWKRTGAWTCHPEGKWYSDLSQPKADRIVFDVGLGPDLTIDYATDKIVLLRDPGLERTIQFGGFLALTGGGTVIYAWRRKRR